MPLESLSAFPEQFLIYLARHATPDRSRRDIPYHTVPGPDLTPDGCEQAAELGQFLKTAGVVHVLSSPLERAWQTGSIASKISGATLELNQDLAEHRLDENADSVLERMQRALLKGAGLSGGDPGRPLKPVALVSHGSPVHLSLEWLGAPAQVLERCRIYDNRNLIPMAGAWRIERDGEDLRLEPVFAPSGIRMPPGMITT